MHQLTKDFLLIGDTFVFNLLGKVDLENDNEYIQDTSDELLQKVGFEDSFVKFLREDYHQTFLSDTIVNLLNESINPAALHLSSILDNQGFSYDTVNCSLKHRKQLVDFLETTNYKVIGISTTFTFDKAYILNLINFIKKNAPTAKVILGGMLVVKLYKLQKNKELQNELSQFSVDYFIINEIGEQPLIDILNYELRSKNDIKNIPNIAYQTENGLMINEYKTNNIDSSISDWTLANKTTYAFLRTSISCMFKCKFCDFPVIADKYQSKSIEIIRQEFRSIKKSGIKYIRFLDDTFNLPKQHFQNILNELINQNYNFEWVAYIRCQTLDDETVHLMKKSGCIGVFLGIESGNNKMLKNMNKGATAEEYLQGISFLHKYDIPTYGAFIIGFPGETEESIEDTISFIKQAKLKYYRLFTWIFNRLSPIANEKEKYSIEGYEIEWKHSTMTSSEAIEKCKLIMKEVDTSIHCTIPFDYTFYLNNNVTTKEIFNESLRCFNNRNNS